jgi:hypothetical protein
MLYTAKPPDALVTVQSGMPDHCDPNGMVLTLQGSIGNSGDVTITATKIDGSQLGAGTYYVRVYDPNDGIPGNHCTGFNVVKGNPYVLGGSANNIVFPSFPSLLTCGGQEKAYCVTKLAGGDGAFYCSNKQVRVNYN